MYDRTDSASRLRPLSLTLLAPLEIFATLQQLDLLPAWPILPHPADIVPLSPSSPVQWPALPDCLGIRSSLSLLTSLFLSPLFLWGMLYWARPLVSQKLYAYLRAALPKPTNPDRYSFQAAKESEIDGNSVPGLYTESSGRYPSSTALEELARDLQHIGKTFILLYDRLTWRRHANPAGIVRSESRPADQPPLPNLDILNLSSQPNEEAANASPSFAITDTQYTTPSSTSEDPFFYPPTRLTTPHPSMEIITTTASTGTIRMNVQMPAPDPSNEGFSSNNLSDFPPASDDGHIIKTTAHRPRHRITALTSYATDSMASHLASQIADVLFLPLEALFVRSVAIAFLSSPAAGAEAQAAATRWKSEVLPFGGWFGIGLRGGWSGVCDYVGKMTLVSGMEVGIWIAIWQACTGISWWCGRKWFTWGKL